MLPCRDRAAEVGAPRPIRKLDQLSSALSATASAKRAAPHIGRRRRGPAAPGGGAEQLSLQHLLVVQIDDGGFHRHASSRRGWRIAHWSIADGYATRMQRRGARLTAAAPARCHMAATDPGKPRITTASSDRMSTPSRATTSRSAAAARRTTAPRSACSSPSAHRDTHPPAARSGAGAQVLRVASTARRSCAPVEREAGGELGLRVRAPCPSRVPSYRTETDDLEADAHQFGEGHRRLDVRALAGRRRRRRGGPPVGGAVAGREPTPSS